MSLIVTGPLVIARAASGELKYVYQGSPLPADVPADEAARLVDTGLVTDIAADSGDADAAKPRRAAKG